MFAVSRIRFYSRGESVRGAVSAATEPAFISGAKYGYADFRRFIRSTEHVQPKHHILSHVSVLVARQSNIPSFVKLNGVSLPSHEALPRDWVISFR